VPVWRVDENQIVFAPALSCGAQEGAGVGAVHLGLQSEGGQVVADGPHGGVRAVHEHGLGGPARQGLDAQRARAGEQVQHPQALDVAEGGEQRLAHAVRGRPGPRAAGRDQAPPPELSGDDAHPPIFPAADGRRGRGQAGIGSSASAP